MVKLLASPRLSKRVALFNCPSDLCIIDRLVFMAERKVANHRGYSFRAETVDGQMFYVAQNKGDEVIRVVAEEFLDQNEFEEEFRATMKVFNRLGAKKVQALKYFLTFDGPPMGGIGPRTPMYLTMMVDAYGSVLEDPNVRSLLEMTARRMERLVPNES